MNEAFVTSLELTPLPHHGVFGSEVFTIVQRVIKQASAKGHSVGSALSLETGWDFRRLANRKAGLLVVEREKPYLLVCAFPADLGQHSCASTLRVTLNKDVLKASS